MKRKKSINLKKLCSENITEFNYDAKTDELVFMIYRYCNVDLDRVSAVDIIFGTIVVPKLASVMRAVQVQKKLIKNKVDGVIR